MAVVGRRTTLTLLVVLLGATATLACGGAGSVTPDAAPTSTSATTVAGDVSSTTPATTTEQGAPDDARVIQDGSRCSVLPLDHERLAPYPVTEWFVPPSPVDRELLPGARTFFEAPTRSGVEGPIPSIALGPDWGAGLRAIAITDGNPIRWLTLVGRLDRDEGSFEALVAVDECHPLALVATTGAVTADGTGWILVRANGGPPELLRVDPGGGAAVVATWPAASDVVAVDDHAHVLGMRTTRNRDRSPGRPLVAGFASGEPVPEEASELAVPDGRLTVWPGGATHERCGPAGGACTVWLLDPATTRVRAHPIPDGWSVVGRSADGLWLRSADTVELRATQAGLPVVASFTIDRSEILGEDAPFADRWSATLTPDGWVFTESVLVDGRTIVYERLEPDGRRTEIARFTSELGQHSREREQRLIRPSLTFVPGGVEYGEPVLRTSGAPATLAFAPL